MISSDHFSRRDFIRTCGAGAAALAWSGLNPHAHSVFGSAQPGKRPNVLFIAVDDLRPQLGCYGHAFMKTPHIDALAASGCQFNRSYCNVPVCGASRASLLSGLRPRRDRFFQWDCRADKDAPDSPTLPAWFKRNGYRTVSLGKIFHHRADSENAWDYLSRDGLPEGEKPVWTGRGYLTEDAIKQIVNQGRKRGIGPAYEAADVPDDAYMDGCLANAAIRELKRDHDKPFFLALGFFKPHLPFNAPKRYWDLYQREDIDLADNPFRPKGAPDSALHNWGELRSYVGIPKGTDPMPDDLARTLIHGYYACTSYIDAQIGRVLAELDRRGLRDNTIVVLWGDHGWNLGEHTLWCKHALFETALHTPLLLRLPGAAAEQKRDHLVEYVDIYPTLCDAAGIKPPTHLEGASLATLAASASAPWQREAAFARYYHGESVKTDRFRYSRYYDRQWQPVGEMLYDHRNDPAENRSIHEDPAHQQDLKQMRNHLAQLAK